MKNNYKDYQIGDTIAFQFGFSCYEGIIEAINENCCSVLLTKDIHPYDEGYRFLIQFNSYSYTDSIRIIQAEHEDKLPPMKPIKIPWWKKLFNIS